MASKRARKRRRTGKKGVRPSKKDTKQQPHNGRGRAARGRGEERNSLAAKVQQFAETRTGLFVGACLICAIVALIQLLPDAQSRVPLSGWVSPQGNVVFNFTQRRSATFSPLCGCDHADGAKKWSGFSFPAKHISLSRPGRTTYMFFSPSPTETFDYPLEQGVLGTAIELAVPRHSSYALPALLAPTPPRRVRVLSVVPLQADFLGLTTTQPLILSASGVGSILPAENSSVDVTLPSGDPSGSLVIKTDAGARVRYEMGPMLDFEGPEVDALTTDSGPVVSEAYMAHRVANRLTGSSTLGQVKFTGGPISLGKASPPPGDVRLTILRFSRNFFAMRVLALPTPATNVLDGTERIPPSFAALEAPLQPKQFQGYGLLTVDVPDATNAEAQLSSDFTIAFPPVSGRTSATRIDVPQLGLSPRSWQLVTKLFVLPPIPPRDGVNVFGAIKRIRFARVTAHLLSGDRHLDLPEGTPLELDDVVARPGQSDPLSVPLQFQPNSVRMDLQDVAKVTENDTRIAMTKGVKGILSFDNFASFAVILGGVALFVGGRWRRSH